MSKTNLGTRSSCIESGIGKRGKGSAYAREPFPFDSSSSLPSIAFKIKIFPSKHYIVQAVLLFLLSYLNRSVRHSKAYSSIHQPSTTKTRIHTKMERPPHPHFITSFSSISRRTASENRGEGKSLKPTRKIRKKKGKYAESTFWGLLEFWATPHEEYEHYHEFRTMI
jgi:hypothetical protein